MNAAKFSERKSTLVKKLMTVSSLGLCLTGCAGTLENQRATDSDTLMNWKESMQTMPVEVHGSFAGDDAAEAARLMPNGTTPTLYRTQDHSGSELASAPRIVLYVGVDQIPTDDTYCSNTPELHHVAVNQGEIDVVAAPLEWYGIFSCTDSPVTLPVCVPLPSL